MLKEKFINVFSSILPVGGLVYLLHFVLTPIPGYELGKFSIGLLLIGIGLVLFLLGIDIGVEPAGDVFGHSIAKRNSIVVLILAGLVLGFFITAAEPSVLILSHQVNQVTGDGITNVSLVIALSIAVGVFVSIGLLRIVFNLPLYIILAVSYGFILLLAVIVGSDMTAIAFDASGATTGILTVPFLLSITTGITSMKKQSKSAEKDTFGLIGIAAVGAIIGVLFLGLFAKVTPALPEVGDIVIPNTQVFAPFISAFPQVALDAFMTVFPILVIFSLLQYFQKPISKKRYTRILKGFAYVYVGLVLFFLGVENGFMGVGLTIGKALTDHSIGVLLLVGFSLGFLSIIAEPSVYVLTNKISDVTSGYISKRLLVLSLAIGVGLALVLNTLRIKLDFLELWHVLLIGYIINIFMMFITPRLFIGIAFDAGGVASGPIAATFIFAFSQGIAFGANNQGNLIDLFGLIALVAMTPIIVIQALGILYKIKTTKRGNSL